jgi:O-acetylserine/cysteine efflux transporter
MRKWAERWRANRRTKKRFSGRPEGGHGVQPRDIMTAVLVACIWGLGFTIAKAALAGFPPIFLMALRFTITAAALVWFVRPPVAHMGRVALISLVGAGLQYGFTFTGLKGLDASAAIIIIQLEPAYASLLAAIFLKDMIGWRRAIGMALAFAGVLILAGEPTVQGAYISAGMVMLGSVLFAAGQVMTKALKGAVGGFQLTAWVAVFAVPQLFIGSFIFETGHWTHLKTADPIVWIAILYLGLVMTALGYGLWYRLINKYSINLVMPFILLLPIATVLSAIVLLGERPKPIVLLGGAVTILGVAIIIIRENPFARRRARRASEAE